MYRTVERFIDLQDNGYVYNVGDKFPRSGMTVTKERLEELSSSQNRRGMVLIAQESPSEPTGDALEVKTGEQPPTRVKAEGKPRKRSEKHAGTNPKRDS